MTNQTLTARIQLKDIRPGATLVLDSGARATILEIAPYPSNYWAARNHRMVTLAYPGRLHTSAMDLGGWWDVLLADIERPES